MLTADPAQCDFADLSRGPLREGPGNALLIEVLMAALGILDT